MLLKQLNKYNKNKRATLLGVGPMSKNCVDSAIDISNQKNIPLFLIASRRQIDCSEFKGGYVNNWTTKKFADYVLENDKKGKIILSRDHGGPWQNPLEIEKNFGFRKAMESAKLSFKNDIDAGFQMIHIDPSIDIHSKITVEDTLERIYELYEFCWNYAQSKNKIINFEIGTEEQNGTTNSIEEIDYVLSEVKKFCKINNFPKPLFIVIQTGTKVKETRNIGSFDSPLRVKGEIPIEILLPKMVLLCKKHGILIKEHNADYLSEESLKWHPRLGISACNVAPEFGVVETKAFINILRKYNFKQIEESFLKKSYDSKLWSKWLTKNSEITDREKAIISGHYLFSSPEVSELISKAKILLKKKDINLDAFLKENIKKCIMKYLINFRLCK